jgi:hypothetical protein
VDTFSAPLTPGPTAAGAQTAPVTSSLTATITSTQPVTTPLTGTPGGEVEAGGAITVTETVGPASIVTVTPTPFQYIRVQPREVARSLLEKSLASILIFGGGLLVATIARFLVSRLADRVHPDVRVFLSRLVYIAILIGAILWILRVFEVDAATITAIVGTVGLALSLSSQELFKNFIAGIYLLWERPFSIGDMVQVGDHTGRVEFVDLRTTRLRTQDGEQVILPNTLLMSQVVVKQPERSWRVETRETPEEYPVEEE